MITNDRLNKLKIIRMKEHQVDWSALHTPEEMERLSNIGHWIEGSLLATVAIIALLNALGFIKGQLIWCPH